MREIARLYRLTTLGVFLCSALLMGTAPAATGAGESDSDRGAHEKVELTSGVVVPAEPADRTPSEEAAYRDEIALLMASGDLANADYRRLKLRVVSAECGPPVESVKAGSMVAGVSRELQSATTATCGTANGSRPASAITVKAPVLAMNGSSQGVIYYATARWDWTNPPAGGSTCQQFDGGKDGFGIAFNKTVVNKGVSLVTCGAIGTACRGTGTLSSNSSYGASYVFRDTWASTVIGGGVADRGTLTYSFGLASSGCVQAYSKYGHAWGSTNVNGVGIGPWSISISWSSSTNRWEKSSQAGSYGC